jgi:hypothetical protein
LLENLNDFSQEEEEPLIPDYLGDTPNIRDIEERVNEELEATSSAFTAPPNSSKPGPSSSVGRKPIQAPNLFIES